MPLEETRAKILAEIEAGKLYQARDRLHGLICSYPNDVSLRWLLGDVYWRLSYPAMAGRWWWIYPPDRPEVDEALSAFIHACGGKEDQLMIRSRPHPDPKNWANENVSVSAQALLETYRKRRGEKIPAPESEGIPCGYIIAFSVLLLVSNVIWILRLIF